MLGLRFPERPRGRHLGHDLPRPETGGLDVGDRLLRDASLLVVQIEDRRAIARSDVVALPVERRRVVDLEEELEQIPVRGLLGIEADLDRLRVHVVVAVGRVGNLSPRVSDPRGENARSLPEEILHPPEAPSGENCLLDCSGHPASLRRCRFA